MFNRSWFVPLLLGSLMACTSLIAGHSNLVQSASLQDKPATPTNQSSTPTTPAKTITIQVNGKPQTIPLGLVQTRCFSTYYPIDRFVLEKNSLNNTVTFSWKRADGTKGENTLIGFIFYPKNTNLASVKEMADVFALSVWGARKVEQSPAIDYAKRAYSSWLKDITRIENKKLPNTADSGAGVVTAYYGEVNGQVFAVISSYSPQDKDEFTSREDVILKNLKVKNEIQ